MTTSCLVCSVELQRSGTQACLAFPATNAPASASRPIPAGGEYRRKLARHLRSDVLDEDRPHFSIDFSFDQSQIFRLGQSLRKHTVADAVVGNAHLEEAGRIFDERGGK